ncbi:MAG: DsbA family protein, partial [Nannocystaceae bacterium]
MKRISIPVVLVAALSLTASSMTGCTGSRRASKDKAAAADAKGDNAAPGSVVTMDQVDDSLNAKVQGERFRVTYTEKDYYKGAAEPLVTIVEFSDYQCPYCSKFTKNLEELVADPAYKDDVRIVFKHYPLPMHKDANPGSQASLAAGAQGKFWEYHDLLFANQRKMDRAALEGYAEQVGIDVEAFKKALDSGEFKAQVQADMKQGQQFGVRGTPSFFLNGKWQRGAPRSIDGLKKLVDDEKKHAEELIKAGAKRSEIYARIMKAGKDKRTP